MPLDAGEQASQLVLALAADAGAADPRSLDVPLGAFSWLAPCPELFMPDPLGHHKRYDWSGGGGRATFAVAGTVGDRLADAAGDDRRPSLVRVGWLYVAGRAADGRSVFEPVVTVAVTVRRGGILGEAHLVPEGDGQISPGAAPSHRRLLAEQLDFGGPAVAALATPVIPPHVVASSTALRRFALRAAAAFGHDASAVVPADASPERFRDADALVVVAGFGAYVAADIEDPPTPSPALGQWSTTAQRRPSAFHVVHGLAGIDDAADAPAGRLDVAATQFLSAGQRAVVARARTAGLTVVDAGSAEVETVLAVAADAVDRGERVLVVAPGAELAETLVVRLLAEPGPPPVAFGSTTRSDEVLTRLAESRHPVPVADLAEAAVARDRTEHELRRRLGGLQRELAAEVAWRRRQRAAPAAEAAWAPGLFGPQADIERARELTEQLRRGGAGTWSARRRLLRLAGAPRGTEAERLGQAVDAGIAEAGADVLDAIGGVDLSSAWARVAAVDEHARAELRRWRAAAAGQHDSRGRSRLTTLRTIGEVHRALRLGRSARRLQLDLVTSGRLTRVLPLWVGMLHDVGELLPLRSSLFDLVIVAGADRATALTSAPALLRSDRAVVVTSGGEGVIDDDSLVAIAARATPVLVLDDPTGAGLGFADLDPAERAWHADVVATLDEAGLEPRPFATAGRHLVDVAVDVRGAVAIHTGVHPAGVDAHIDRHLELARAGWRMLEVFPSRWSTRLEKLADHLENPWRG